MDAAPASSSAADATTRQPTACIVIGMAGSGKTTLMQRLNADLHEAKTPYYLVNLDPAVLETPFGANIDVRDTVNYREVMKQYQLGPNGGILTALNFFATRFEQVLTLIEARRAEHAARVPCDPLRYVLLDTPGQIEIFTWSASGQIITEWLQLVEDDRLEDGFSFLALLLPRRATARHRLPSRAGRAGSGWRSALR